MRTTKLGLWILFTVAFLFVASDFTAKNADPLTFQIFNWISPNYAKWQVLLATLCIGAIAATVFFIFEFIVLETRIIRLKRTNQKLERALAALQTKTAANGSAGPTPSTPSLRPDPSLRVEEDV